jgi:translation initiation factor 2 alpha subunit (eIF-2alpha)
MSNLECPFYELLKPDNDELVLVTFTAYKDSHIEGKLVDYSNEVFLNYADATKKRSVSSWKKIVPLNKPMVAKVEDNNSDVIQVSLSYIYDSANDDNSHMEAFVKNTQLISFFKKLSIVGKRNMTELWKAVMYTIDENRRDEYEPEDLPCLLDYCNDEREFVESVFDESGNSDLYPKFIELLDNLSKEKPYKIVSKIEIISNGGIKNTIQLFKKAIESIDYNYSLKYDTAPTFLFESNSVESSDEDHTKLVKFLEAEGQKLNPKTFVRCVATSHS